MLSRFGTARCLTILLAAGAMLNACTPADKSTHSPDANARRVTDAAIEKNVDIPAHDRMEAARVTRDVRSLPMFNGMTGAPMNWSQLLAAVDQVNVLLVGEAHGHPIGLATEAALFDDLVRRIPTTGLSLEFFERDEQDALDDYLTGITTEDQFLRAADRTVSNYPFGHREMVEDAKANHRVVIAANAPRRYVTAARIDGFDRLSSLMPEQRRLFVIPDRLSTGRYRDDFYKLMEGMPDHMGDGAAETDHSTPAKGMSVDDLFRAQNVWDATMADSILKALSAGVQPVVHIVGEFHTDFSGGTVQRIGQQRPDVLCWTISLVPEDCAALRDEDKGRADCVIYIGPSPR